MTSFVTRTIGDVVSEILMSRSVFAGAFLVVEGDNDIKFWQTRIANRSICQLVLAGSKPTVTGAVIRANGLKQLGILGVIDDDYDSLRGQPVPSINIIRIETRDIETLMLRSEALDRVLGELGDRNKIDALEQREGRGIRNALIERARIFGQLRYLNLLQGWNIDCWQILRPWRFADVPSWSFRVNDVLREFSNQVPGLTPANLGQQVAGLPNVDPWLILHGKDTLNVLAVGLRNVIGNEQQPAERISQMLRLAFDNQLFQVSALYANVKNWEVQNAPYRVLPT